MKLKMVALGLSLGALVLTGCGGVSTEPTKITKVIMDDPIVGLGYTCSPSAPSEKKFTDENGKFTCYEDDKVTFYIGGYEIGTAEASEGTVDTMRIADLGVADDAITDIRRVLQTIDNTEGDDMIVIPGNFSGLDEMDVMPGDDGFEGNVTAELRHNGVIDSDEELVSAEDADRHADEAYIKYLLITGKTFYAVEIGKSCGYIDTVTVDSDASNIVTEGATMPMSFDGSMVILELDGVSYPSEATVQDKYIEFTGHNKRLYYDKADAEAYVESLGECTDGGSIGVITETDVRAALINKTLYRAYLCDDQTSVKKIEIGENTFNFDDEASVEVTENAPFTITDNTVNFDDGGNIVQVTLITELSVTFHDNEENDDHVWYYSREDAIDHASTCDDGSEGDTAAIKYPASL